MIVGQIDYEKKKFPGEGEVLIIFLFKNNFKIDTRLALLDKKTKNKISEKIKRHNFQAEEKEILHFEIDDFYKEILIVGLGEEKDFSLAKFRNILAEALIFIQKRKLKKVTTFYFHQLGKNFFDLGKEISLAFYLANYFFDKYKSDSEKKKIFRLENLKFIFESDLIFNKAKEEFKKGLNFGKIISEGIYLTRDLVNEPGFSLHPQTLAEKAFEIEKKSQGKIKVEVLDEDECRRLGMGAYLAVGQGSEKKPKFIILKYQPKKTSDKKICLIGKSITFDSGGLSLKPSEAMETMKIDMAGGAVVLGVFEILSQLPENIKIEKEIYGILPACENMPSGKAIRPGDIVWALNGKTIEIVNTDAEGRLTIADAISYAQKFLKAQIIIDLATLTGACMVALGSEITGMWGNDEKLNRQFIEIAKKEKEELWLMPLFKPYKEKLKSEVADIKNVTGEKYGGAITASLFIEEFVDKARWIHLDIAGPVYNLNKEKEIYKKGATGWGVLTLIEFLKLKIN